MTLRQSTLEHHPRLAQLSGAAGTIQDYYRSIADQPAAACDPGSRELLGGVAQRLADHVYGTSRHDLGSILRQPATIVSLADHHAPIAHPLTMSSMATQSLYAMLSGARMVNFTCASVPLDNDLFPRGMVIAGQKVPFLPKKHRRKSVLTCPLIDGEMFDHNLERARSAGVIGAEVCAAVRRWWSSVVPRISTHQHYWQQVSTLNQSIYDSLFDVGVPAPLMLPIELVARDMLLADIEQGRDTWLERSIFEPAARSALSASLNGVRCFWNTPAWRGTFLFWSVEQDSRLQPVFPAAGSLVLRDGRVACRIDPEAIRDAMHKGDLIPAGSYALLRLVLQCRLRNFGGPLQYDYLSHARRRLLAGMAEHLTADELRDIGSAPDSYYVDFEERAAFRGELGRITNPVTPADIALLGTERIGETAGKALSWIDTLVTRY